MPNPAIFIGEPLSFQGKIKIFPPRVKDVITNPNFGLFYKILTMSQDDIREEIKDKVKENESIPTPFEYLILSCKYIKGYIKVVEEALYFFCRTKVIILFEDNRIVFQSNEHTLKDFYLFEGNFFEFQNALRCSNGDKPLEPPEPDNPNEDPRVKRIKEKARERDRIKQKQGNKNGISLESCLVAICCMGIGITPLNIGEMSYASIGAIMKMMQEKERYDIDIRSLLAGADSKKIKPKYWIRNLDKE